MKNTITDLLSDESLRRHEFPTVKDSIFMAHAGVTALPRCAVDAILSLIHI